MNIVGEVESIIVQFENYACHTKNHSPFDPLWQLQRVIVPRMIRGKVICPALLVRVFSLLLSLSSPSPSSPLPPPTLLLPLQLLLFDDNIAVIIPHNKKSEISTTFMSTIGAAADAMLEPTITSFSSDLFAIYHGN